MTINYAFAIHHRRLRSKFQMATIERHEARIASALYKRVYGQ
jgi:hypothetical protein